MAATDSTIAPINETAKAPAQPLQAREMWEVDVHQIERGIRRVRAELFPTRADDEYRALLAEEGEPIYDYQWEVESSGAIYPARLDGTFVEDYDSGTRIFTSGEAAARFCAKSLQARIENDQRVLAKLVERWNISA